MKLQRKNRNKGYPAFANINLLGKCNADCYFCLGKDISDLTKPHNHMRVDFHEWNNFTEFLNKIKDMKIKRVFLTGLNTDPLLYKYLKDLISYLQNASWGFEVGLRTNGFLALKKQEAIQMCNGEIGYTVHTLNSDTQIKINRRHKIPDWDSIFKITDRCRVSIVINKFNCEEFWDLITYLSKFPQIQYIQIRQVSTETRFELLSDDIQAYNKLFRKMCNCYHRIFDFHNSHVFKIHEKQVVFWKTVETSINSWNYFTDGIISDNYFIIEGYQKGIKRG